MSKFEAQQEMKDILDKHVLSFARYTITDRAIPNLVDGLKPIHKRILWSMHLDGLHYNKNRTKSVNAVGSVLRFSPHGDSSVYGAMVRLTNDSLNFPLLDGKGSFSSVTTTAQAGASRYTNIRLGKIVTEVMKDINKNAVTMGKNYDETLEEPLEMPSSIPLILLNPNKGIAMGIASNICSFNMSDVFNNVKNIINKKDTFAMYPDFPTGGTVNIDDSIAKKVKDNGVGSFRIRAKYHFEENSIIVSEIPYGTTREAIIDSVIKGSKSGIFKDINNVNDNTGAQGLEIEIECKRNTNLDDLIARLFKSTPLELSFSCNFNVLLNGKPVTMGTDSILKEWVKFRVETIKNVFNHDLKKHNRELNRLYGLEKILLDSDRAIEIIKTSESDENVDEALMNSFNINEEQSQYVANMKLRNINKGFITNKIKQIKVLEDKISKMKNIMNNDDKIHSIIIEELSRIEEEYGQERKTLLENHTQFNTDESEIEDYNLKLFITKDLYLKKLPLTSMRGKFTNRLKEDDSFVVEEELTNTGEIIVFTNKRNVYKKRLHEIEDTRPSELGEYVPSMFNYEKGEQPLFVLPLRKEFNQNIILGFSDGSVAKIDSKAYYTKQNRQVLKNGYADKELIYVGLDDEVKLKAITSDSYAVVRDLDKFSSKASRSANGNRFMTVNEGEKVVEYVIANKEDIDKYEIVSAGKGRRVK